MKTSIEILGSNLSFRGIAFAAKRAVAPFFLKIGNRLYSVWIRVSYRTYAEETFLTDFHVQGFSLERYLLSQLCLCFFRLDSPTTKKGAAPNAACEQESPTNLKDNKTRPNLSNVTLAKFDL